MDTIIDWLKRILKIGLLEFLRSIGWRFLGGVVLAFVALIGLVIVLTLILLAVLL